MSVTSGVSNSTNGLVLHIDAYNINKSWKGRPVTNNFVLPTVDVNGFSVQSSTFTRVRSGNYGGYDITGNDYVWRFDFTSALTCPYHGNDTTVSVGVTYTFSFDYYVSPDAPAGGYGTRNLQLANFEQAISASVSDTTPTVVGVWKRAVVTGTTSSTNLRALLYPGSCNVAGGMSSSGYILFKNPQVEASAPGNNPSSFVADTRSNTQAVLDLTGNNTVTASSLTYNSDNTFSFNGSNNYLTIANNSNVNPGGGSFTIQGWMYITGASSTTWHMLVANRGQGGTGGYYVGVNDTSGGNFMLTNDAGTRTDTSTTGTPTWQYNKWFMVTAILDRNANTQTLIINDNAQSFAITPAGGNYANTSPLNIGGDVGAGSYYTNGKIATLKVYNRALSISEVKDNFNALKTKFGL